MDRNYEFPLDTIPLLYLIIYVALTAMGFCMERFAAYPPATFTCPCNVLYPNTGLDGIYCVLCRT